jgi:biopolymer transport protein ExbD
VTIEPTIISIQAVELGYVVVVDGQEASLAEAPQRTLEHILAANPALTQETAFTEARVFVRADLDVAYQSVIEVVETLQDARFQRVAIVAQDADATL